MHISICKYLSRLFKTEEESILQEKEPVYIYKEEPKFSGNYDSNACMHLSLTHTIDFVILFIEQFQYNTSIRCPIQSDCEWKVHDAMTLICKLWGVGGAEDVDDSHAFHPKAGGILISNLAFNVDRTTQELAGSCTPKALTSPKNPLSFDIMAF